MKVVLQVALGILAASGGFVDISELVLNGQAGSRFGYGLGSAILVGLGGAMVFSEMSGRVAAVSQRAVFDLIRERMGLSVGLVPLGAGEVVCLMTLTAELGGVERDWSPPLAQSGYEFRQYPVLSLSGG